MQRHSIFAILPLAVLALNIPAHAGEPDWSEGAIITAPRQNPYLFTPLEYSNARREGYLHALEYPLNISGVMVPWKPTRALLDDPTTNPIRAVLKKLFAGFIHIRNTDDLFARVGLHTYPKTDEEGADKIPHRGVNPPEIRMGVTLLNREGVEAFTISCAACHSSNLFGKKILGLTNRFPRANEFFHLGKKAVRAVPTSVFSAVMWPTPAETKLYARLRSRLRAIGTKEPVTLGLDTSLAQVALSLALRADDEYASFDSRFERRPRKDPLSNTVADSKPAVWWNTKYKNRWLSDGSVVSGNPIFTNILWNEIGRGTDLHELEEWFATNSRIIEELTTAVFSTEAPRITEFFPANRISVERAKKGEILFNKTCSGCHGTYVKAWQLADASALPLEKLIETTEVHYPKQTKVINVGTDANRREGMKSLEKLNDLSISKRNGIKIKVQSGYVPPPLVGIWARFPYFHNNSAPNLCAVLTAGPDRPSTYWAGEAIDRDRDYDFNCGGYPTDSRVPLAWTSNPEHFYDSKKPGMGNRGHDVKIFIKDGVEIFTPEEKLDIVEFLKTL
jgi:mono/diheme cytochrome c family protein